MVYTRHPLGIFNNIGLLNTILAEIGGTIGHTSARNSERSRFPKINVSSKEDNVILKAEVPGVDPKDIDLSVEEDKVTISGNIPEKTKDEREFYHRSERLTGAFKRELTLPFRIDVKNVSAAYNNGILTLQLQKREEDKPRKIEVKTA